MKKIVTLLLVLALLVPMCLTANAEAEKKSFQAVTWSKPIDGYSNIENLYRIDIKMQGSFVRMGSLVYGSYTDADVTAMAERMKNDLNARPEGQRYIHFFGPSDALELMEKEVYMDAAAEQLIALADALFAKYYEIGGQVEGAMMSMLYPDMSAYYITQKLGSDSKLLGKIVRDPRYATQIRPLLVERGFQFYQGNLTDYTPEIYGITGKAGSQYSTCQSIWSTVMKNRLNEFIRDWAYEPMAKYFPNVHVSDYQSTDTDARLKPLSTDGGVIGAYSGDGYRAGNTSSDKYYSNTPTSDEFYGKIGISYKNLPTYMGTTYRQTSFNSFKFDMNTAKQAFLSDPDHAVSFWVNAYRSTTDNNNNVNNSPYYAEQVYHLNMYDPKPFVVFTGDDLTGDNLTKAITIANDLLSELTRVVGYADRKAIETPIDWNSEYMLSGMYANGKNYWRISPNRDLVSKEAFQVAGNDPTFYVAGQTISFPGGKLLAEGVTSVPTYGYWVETASNVTPVIKNDADRFVKYPAYIENYENYAVDTHLTSANVKELNAWTIQPKGNDLLVSTQGNNKVLSITGDSRMENKLIPGNVTVGDSYAKKQAWEITVTIPAGMASDAQVVLMNYKAAGMDVSDGGFLIKGGKLYYAIGEEDLDYEPIYAELLTLEPGTYTLRRDMHFGQTFFCDYSVISGGAVLRTVEKVKIPTFTGKVETIGISCSDMNVNLQLDNYTLRATSAAADLSLYTADLGLKRDVGANLNASVNYRLSWANASDKVETATVKAVIGNTTQVIKALTLNPGCDGVEYGTVTLAAGQTANVYLETSIQDEKIDLPVATEPTAPIQVPTQPVATQPVVTQPVVTQPVVTQPVATIPVATLPVATQPTATRPVTIVIPVPTQPGATVPVATVPVATQPGATVPVATIPVATVPVATQPGVTLPVATQPVATQPGATVPVVTVPVATQPGATVPVATVPVATQPVVTQPVVTVPVVTAPVATQPGFTAATRVPVGPAPSAGTAPTRATRPGQTEVTGATQPVQIETTPVPGVTAATQTPGAIVTTPVPGVTNATQTPGTIETIPAIGATDATLAPGATDATLAPGATDVTLAPTDATLAPGATDVTLAPTDVTETTEVTDATQETTPADQDEDKAEKKGLSGGQIALIIVAVLAVAGGGTAAWYFLIYKKKPVASATEAEEIEETEEAEETEE